MRGGTSSALISGYSTFLRLRSEARCCRREIFFARRVRTRERRAAMETMRVTRNGAGRSVGQRSVGREERSSRDTSRERSSARGPLNPTRAGSPRAPPPGARPRPRDFRFQGFGGLSERRTFLGLVLVWPLVALGLTCVAARTTRRTGAPIMTAMFLCVEWREGALLGVKARPTRTAIIVIEKGKRERGGVARCSAALAASARPAALLKNARIKKDEKTKTARHTSDRIIRDGESETGVLFRTERSFVIVRNLRLNAQSIPDKIHCLASFEAHKSPG